MRFSLSRGFGNPAVSCCSVVLSVVDCVPFLIRACSYDCKFLFCTAAVRLAKKNRTVLLLWLMFSDVGWRRAPCEWLQWFFGLARHLALHFGIWNVLYTVHGQHVRTNLLLRGYVLQWCRATGTVQSMS